MLENVIERIAATVLSRYLGAYVKGLQKENLNLRLSEGNVILENLELRREALQDLDLPIAVYAGSIGRLSLFIPWRSLGSDPAVIKIEKVFLLVGPKLKVQSQGTGEQDAAEEDKRELSKKRQLLTLDEISRPKQTSEPASSENSTATPDMPSAEEEAGFLSRMAKIVINNLQVYIDGLHVRYEDDQANPKSPFSLGITLEHVHAVTTDDEWNPHFFSANSPDTKFLYKLVTLKNLAVYWNSNTPNENMIGRSLNLNNLDVAMDTSTQMQELRNRLQDLIYTENNRQEQSHYILKPICGSLKLILNGGGSGHMDLRIPKITASFEFDQIAINLEDCQYKDMLDALDNFVHYSRYKRYHRFRVAGRDAKSLWKFALDSTLHDVHEKRKIWLWDYIREAKYDRDEYIRLVKDQKVKKQQSPDDQERLNALELKIPLETLKIYRQLADAFVSKREEYEKKMRTSQALLRQQQEEEEEKLKEQQSSWSGWLGLNKVWNYLPATSYQVEDLSFVLSPDVMKELYQTVEQVGEKEEEETRALPNTFVDLRVIFSLGLGSVEILSSSPIAKASFDSLMISFDRRHSSSTFSCSIGYMSVHDYHETNTQFKNIISPVLPDDPINVKREKPVTEEEINDAEDDCFSLIFDRNPLDSIGDYRVEMYLKPLNIIVSRPFISRVTEFFAKPLNKIRRRRMGNFELKAYSRLQEIRQQTEMGLMKMMEEKKILDLQIHLSAPNIIIPKAFDKTDSATLIFVLGMLDVTTDLSNRKNRKKTQPSIDVPNDGNDVAKEVDEDEDSDFDVHTATEDFDAKTTDDYFSVIGDQSFDSHSSRQPPSNTAARFLYLYDNYYLSLSSASLLVSRKAKEFVHHSMSNIRTVVETSPEVVIDRFDVNFLIQICNIHNVDLPRVIVQGQLPHLSLFISPEKVAKVMQISDMLTAKKPTTSEENNEDASNPGGHDAHKPDIPAQTAENTVSPIETEKRVAESVSQLVLAKFSIPKISIIFRQEEEVHQDVVKLTAYGIQGSVVKFPLDLTVDLKVKSAKMKDMLQKWGEEYKWLASSDSSVLNHIKSRADIHDDSSSPMNASDLITVCYTNTQPTSLKWSKVRHSIDFQFSEIHVMCNRETIVSLVDCLKNILRVLKRDKEEEDPKKGQVAPPVEEYKLEEGYSFFKVKLFMKRMAMTLNDSGKKMAIIDFIGFELNTFVRNDWWEVHGVMGGVKIRDLGPYNVIYRQMVDIPNQEREMMSFSFTTFDPLKAKREGHHAMFKVEMNSVRIVWLQHFISDLKRFYSEVEGMRSLVANSTSLAAWAMQDKSIVCYEYILNNPIILVPQSHRSLVGLIADLGRIRISKSYPVHATSNVDLEQLLIVVKSLNVKTGMMDGSGERNSSNTQPESPRNTKPYPITPLIGNTDIEWAFDRPYDPMANMLKPDRIPNLTQRLTIPVLDITFTEEQFVILFKVVEENICWLKNKDPSVLSPSNDTLQSSVNQTSSATNNVRIIREEDTQSKWLDSRFIFKMGLLRMEVKNGDGLDATGNSTSVGFFEGLGYEMDYRMFSDTTHDGDFYIRAWKLVDTRYNSDNIFKEIIAPRLEQEPNIRSSTSDPANQEDEKLCNISIVGNRYGAESSEYQLVLHYERRVDSSQQMELIWNHCYVICVPDFIFNTVRYIWPKVQEIMRVKDIYNNWKNPIPQVIVDPEAIPTVQELKIKMTLNNPELCFLEDTSAVDTEVIILSAIFNIVYRRNNTTQERRWCFLVDGMEGCKCKLRDVRGTGANIMEPLNFTVDYVSQLLYSQVTAKIDPITINFSYKDGLSIRSIANLWIPFLKGGNSEENKIHDPGYDGEEITDETHSRYSHDSETGSNGALVMKALQSVNSENEESEASGNEVDDYINQLDDAIKSAMNDLIHVDEGSSYSEDDEIISDAESGPKIQMKRAMRNSGGGVMSLDMDEVVERVGLAAERIKNKRKQAMELISGQNIAEPEPHEQDELVTIRREGGTPSQLLLENDALAKQNNDSANEHKYVEVKTNGIKLTIIDDALTGAQHNPLAAIWLLDLEMEMSATQEKRKMFLSTKIYIDYYNSSLEVWEPMLEPWSAQLKAEKSEKLTRYRIIATRRMDFNITRAMIETILNAAESVRLSQEEGAEEVHISESLPPASIPISLDLAEANKMLRERKSFPFLIRNRTGLAVWYWLAGPKEKSIKKLEPEADEPIIPQYMSNNRKLKKETDVALTCSFQVDGEFTPVKNLPMDKVGTYVARISPSDGSTYISYEVAFFRGSKVLTVSSNVLICNSLQNAVETLIEIPGKESILLPPMAPNATVPIPLQHAYRGTIRFRPTPEHDWHKGGIVLSKLPGVNMSKLCETVTISKGKEKQEAFYFLVHSKSSHGGKMHVLTLHPPFLVENLLATNMEFRILNRSTKTEAFSGSVAKGESFHITKVDPHGMLSLSITIAHFQWSKFEDISSSEPSQYIKLMDSMKRTLTIRIVTMKEKTGIRRVSLYCEYWMINFTGLRLLYKLCGRITDNNAAGQSRYEYDMAPLPHHPRDWYRIQEEHDEVSLLGEKDREAPFMFSIPEFTFFGGHLASVKIANSCWSQPMNLASQGSSCVLEIEDSAEEGKLQRIFVLGVTITSAPDPFWRTKIITFAPHFVLVNNLVTTLFYHQYGTVAHVYELKPKECIPFHWTDSAQPRKICIRIDDANYDWSGPFEIHELGNFCIKMRGRNGEHYLPRIRIKLDGATQLVIVNPVDKEFPDYRIDNLTKRPIKFQQLHCKNFDIIPPETRIPYAWDEPHAVKRLLLLRLNDSTVLSRRPSSGVRFVDQIEVNLDKLQKYPLVRVGFGQLRVKVYAEGPTKVLCVKYAKMTKNNKRRDLIKAIEEEEIHTEAKINLEGISISIVDDTPQELMYLSIDKINLEYSDSNVNKKIEFTIGWIQCDNQLYETPYSVILYPIIPKLGNESNIFVHLSVIKSNRTSSIHYFSYLSFLVQEMDLKLDENFLLKMISFVSYISDYFKKRKEIEDEKEMRDSSVTTTQFQQRYLKYANTHAGAYQSKWLYFEFLHLNPVKVNLSFANMSSVDRDYSSSLSRVLEHGGVLANIDAAPLQLGGLLLEHPFVSRSDLLDRVVKHYVSSAIREFHKVLGSADFLGSPLSFVRTMGTGFYDFFHEPAQGLVSSPKDFGIGIILGTKSLVKNSAFGAFNSVAKVTGTLGKGVAQLTFDREYLREREAQMREKPKHAGEGLAYGFKEFGTGVFKGLGSVVYEPVRGVMDDGATGLGKGVLRGILGLGLKPTAGVVDLFTRTAEGIRNTTTYWDLKERTRRRPPRYFGRDKLLLPYNKYRAEGQQLLYTVEEGKYSKEWYMWHKTIENSVIVVSDGNIISMNKFNPQIEEWSVNLKDIRGLELAKTGIFIHLSDYLHSNAFETPTSKRVIWVPPSRKIEIYEELLELLKLLKHPGIRS